MKIYFDNCTECKKSFEILYKPPLFCPNCGKEVLFVPKEREHDCRNSYDQRYTSPIHDMGQ